MTGVDTGRVKRRPMVGVAIAVACGMLFGSLELLSPPVSLSIAALMSALAFAARRHPVSLPATFLLIALVSACRFQLAVPGVAADAVERLRFGSEERAGFVGEVVGAPRRVRGRFLFTLKCAAVEKDGEWKTISGRARVVANQDVGIERGQRLLISGRVGTPRFPSRERHEIVADSIEVLEAGPWTLVRWGAAARGRAERALEKGMDRHPTQLAVLKALVLGLRGEASRDVMDTFRRTGALHIFAISGLHVGIVGLLIVILLKTLGAPRDAYWMFLIPLLAFYVLSTGMKSSATRAFAMAAVFMLAPMFRRAPDIPSSVALAAVLLTWFQPLQIVSPGFVFSFMVVSCIVMVYAVAPQRWTRGGWLRTSFASLFITSCAASLASIPLAALYFGTFSPISLIGNLIVVPLTFFIVLCGWLSIALPFAAAVFNAAAVVFIDVLLASVRALDAIPGSSWKVAPPSLWAVALWFASLAFVFTHVRSPRYRRVGLAGACAAALLGLLG